MAETGRACVGNRWLNRRPSWRGLALGIFVYVIVLSAHAQRVDFTYSTYGLEIDADNVIRNASHLDAFFERLFALRHTGECRINIVHIGDSHIQADYLTSIVRRNFHRHFGNAGRGLIVPLRVAGTNEPNNFKTASNTNWKSKRCVFPDQPLPIGLGGVTISTADPRANLQLFMNDLWLDYRFNALTLFYEKNEKSFDFVVRGPRGAELGRAFWDPNDSTKNAFRVAWEEKVNTVDIQAHKTNAGQNQAIIFGAVLENSMPGVLYHTIGVNGARYSHYNDARYFADQTAMLDPDLFIISLGTNESINYPYIDRDFSKEIHDLLSGLRKRNPAAAFILVTPQDVFMQKNKPNPGILQIRQSIIDYAVENGCAFYDMYRAMGGQHSAQHWRANSLLASDGVHLTKDGYEYQGNLFYHALMKSYNSYVPNRHP